MPNIAVKPYLETADIFAGNDPITSRPNIPPCPHCSGKGEYYTYLSTTNLVEEVINIRCTNCTYKSFSGVIIKPYTEQILIERWLSGFVGPMAKPLTNLKTGEIVEDKINRWHLRHKKAEV